MKLVTVEEMRELDRRTIEEYDIPGEVLMDRAGRGVADVVRRLAEVSGFIQPRILLLAGRGNNGGDAFTAARHLKEAGLDPEVWLAGGTNQVKGDALKQLSHMKSAGVNWRELPTKEDWDDALTVPAGADMLVDGLLGTGSTGPARGPAVGAIEFINANAADALVIAIDVPSGLNADTGEAQGDAVRADLTVTMALPKRGLVQSRALDHVGSIEVVDIGVPAELVAELAADRQPEMIYVPDIKKLFPRRPRAAHKGNYGHVLLVGGAKGYTGAIVLAARAALRSGVGLVSVLTPASQAGTVAGCVLEAMVHAAPETAEGSLSADLLAEWSGRFNEFDAVLVGPGLTRGKASSELVYGVLEACTTPLVIDADAITVLAGDADALKRAQGRVVLTPHPGEMAALAGLTVADVQADRPGVAAAIAERSGAVVVLKGAGTVVAAEGTPHHINMSGNPGMATGGAGDVLAGLLTGLLGQGLPPFDAARAGVFLHGRAGDMAAWRKSQAGLVAGDLIDEIPYAFRELTLR